MNDILDTAPQRKSRSKLTYITQRYLWAQVIGELCKDMFHTNKNRFKKRMASVKKASGLCDNANKNSDEWDAEVGGGYSKAPYHSLSIGLPPKVRTEVNFVDA